MSPLLIIVVSVSVTLLAASLADRFLNPKVAWQDFIWRVTLVAVLVLPLVTMFGRTTWPNGLIQLQVLSSRSIDTQDAAKKEIDLKNDLTAGIDDRDFGTRMTAPSAEISQAKALLSTKTRTDSSETTGPSKSTATKIIAAARPPELEEAKLVSFAWARLVMAAWMLGSLYFLTRFVFGWLVIRNVVVRATITEPAGWSDAINESTAIAGLNSKIQVRVSEEISTPMVAGIGTSIVLVPNSMLQLRGSDSHVRAALAHEAMHIRRADSLWNLMLCLCIVVWWPIPMIHWMRKRMVWLRELLCDASIAVEMGPANYSESLLHLTKLDDRHRVNAFAISMLARKETLESRVKWILKLSNPVSKPSPCGKLIVTCGLAALLLSFTATNLVPASPAFPKQNESESLVATDQEKETQSTNEQRGPDCRGVVKTLDGKILPGATVYFLKRVGNTLPTHPLKAITDERGQYSFTNVDPGKYRIWAEGDGLTSLKKFLGGARVDVTKEQKSIVIDDIVAVKACDYRVTVVSAETKQAIEDAKIHFGWTDIEREYTTGTDGIASICGLASNDWYFVVKADGYATYFEKSAPQTLGSTTDLTFELKPGIEVEFDLRDQFEEPISGATIEIQYQDIGMTPHLIPYPSKTNGDGKLVAKGMPLNTKLRVFINKDGYRFDSIRNFEFDGEFELEQARLVGTKLPYGGDIALKIMDESGQPIAGATATNPSNNSGRYRQATTDLEGKATLTNLYSRSDDKTVIIKAEGKLPQKIAVEPGRKGTPSFIAVTMKPGKILKGVVLTPDGKPAPQNTRVYFNEGEHGRWAGGRVLTDVDGKFSINGLPDLTTLTVYTPQQYEPIEDLKVALDKDGDVTIKVIKMTPTAVLRLRAVDEATGEPIPAFNVRLGFVDREHRLEGDKSGGGISSSWMNPGKNIHGTQKVYRLDHQVAGVVYKVIVSAKGYETNTIERMQTVVGSKSKVIDVPLSKSKD